MAAGDEVLSREVLLSLGIIVGMRLAGEADPARGVGLVMDCLTSAGGFCDGGGDITLLLCGDLASGRVLGLAGFLVV